jgi:D-sedoheptulose 7-phosphate isomerase
MMAILQSLAGSRNTIQAAIDYPAFCIAIDWIVGVIGTALADGRKLLLAGNGGSAADAQHIAGEMLSRSNQTVEDTLASRRPKPDLALVV